MTTAQNRKPVDGIILNVNGAEYVAGDALFTHWVNRATGTQVCDWATADTLDRLLLAARRASK